MDSGLLEIIKVQGVRLVAQGFTNYENNNKPTPVEASREELKEHVLEIYYEVFNRISQDERVSVIPLKQLLLRVFVELNLNSKITVPILTEVSDAIAEFVSAQPGSNPTLLRVFNAYKLLLIEAVSNLQFFSSSSIIDILQKPQEYQYCSNRYSFTPLEVDDEAKKIYTLFPKSRYWEEYSKLSDSTSYSPLYYNRVVSKLGKSKFRKPLEYRDLVIKDGVLYKLVSDVESATRGKFVESEWVEYNPRHFDKTKSFKKVLNDKIQNYYNGFLENGFDINEIISDSKVVEYAPASNIDREFLTSTFGGEGKSIYDSILQLKTLSDYFGAHEGSVLGGMEYIMQYSEYLISSTLGRNTTILYDVVGGVSTFGRFDLIFESIIKPDQVPGLNFLSSFGRLRSFAHGQVIDTAQLVEKKSILYNPVYSAFREKITDRYLSSIQKNTYSQEPKVDLLLYSLEALFNRCLRVGDTLEAIKTSLDSSGKLTPYKGLGPIKPQILEFQRVFPPTKFIKDSQDKISGGFTGSIKYFLDSYAKLTKIFIYPRFPGKALEFVLKWTDLMRDKIETLIESISKLGVSDGSFIPNISIKNYDAGSTSLIQFLRSLGFRDSEIDQLFQVTSFSDLVTKFAPLSDSNDLKSFFKAYELSQLIYEFGGQDGVDAYLSFLYNKAEVGPLLNILDIAQKNKNVVTNIQVNKYPKLIGLLMGLTYAVDPNQLVLFNNILGKNNLTLLESIEYLYQSGQNSIIKSPEQIGLLAPLVDQMIQGRYPDAFSSLDLDYEQVNKVAPIALKQWTEIIGDNLGNVSSKESIHHLYDKSIGLTAKELLGVINSANPSHPLGQLLDGFSGGPLTQFLKYANLAGLTIKLSSYKNSLQLDNFEVDYSASLFTLPVLLESLSEVLNTINVVNIVFDSKLDYDLTLSNSEVVEPLVYSQNKTIETMAEVIKSGATPDLQYSSIRDTVISAPITESPGIGNSRLPNRIPVINSITPEQFTVLFQQSTSVSDMLRNGELTSEGLINRFIKISEANKLINLVQLVDETQQLAQNQKLRVGYSPATAFEDPTNPYSNVGAPYVTGDAQDPSQNKIKPIEYQVPKIYSDLNSSQEVRSQALGAKYIHQDYPDSGGSVKNLLRPFDRIESCKRFGGENCEEIYANSQEMCVGPLNKSLYAEYYDIVPGSSSSNVQVDRPLGTFADYKPSTTFLPTSAFSAPPAYYSLLSDKISGVGKNAEPILTQIFGTPIVFSSGGGEVSEYVNSEFGIVEYIKAKVEKNSEFNCATLSSPFDYQVCMNIMKCKKFSPPYEGKYSLPFCPKTLSGGRLK